MSKLKELREKQGTLAAAIKQMADKVTGESRDFTSEEKPQWEKLNADYNALLPQIEIAQRAAQVEKESAAAAGDPTIGREDFDPKKGKRRDDGLTPEQREESRALALQAWCRVAADKPLKKRHLQACKATRLNPRSKRLAFGNYRTADVRRMQQQFRSVHPHKAADAMREFRVLSAQTGSTGGFLIPPETLLRTLEVNQLYYGGMLQVADVMVTSSGERMSWPTADDTSNTGEMLGENADASNSGSGGANPTLGKLYWDAYKFSSKMILVPDELLEDEAFGLAEILGNMLAERLGRIKNTRYTTGTGSGQPKGIITASTTGYTAASGTAIAADEIIRLEHSIDPAYRMGGGYMMHDSILLALRLLKDGQGRYLWQSGFNDGAPDTLNGRPITVNQDMDSTIASGKKTILFGRLNNYKVRRVNGTRLYRLDERYRDKDQTAFIAFQREDGNLLQAGTQPVKYLLQP